jgi:hypothetical protein
MQQTRLQGLIQGSVLLLPLNRWSWGFSWKCCLGIAVLTDEGVADAYRQMTPYRQLDSAPHVVSSGTYSGGAEESTLFHRHVGDGEGGDWLGSTGTREFRGTADAQSHVIAEVGFSDGVGASDKDGSAVPSLASNGVPTPDHNHQSFIASPVSHHSIFLP